MDLCVLPSLTTCDIVLANHLLNKGTDPIQLQKYLWFANCASLCILGTPLVSFDFRAFKFGPFNRELRNVRHDCTKNIQENHGDSLWNENFEIEIDFLSLVITTMGELEPNIIDKPFVLVAQTHLNKHLYLDLYKKNIGYTKAEVISQELIKKYFGTIEFEKKLLDSLKEKLEEKEQQRLQKQQELFERFYNK